jgi:heme A synthase
MLPLGRLIPLRRLAQGPERAAPVDGSRALRVSAGVAAVLVLATIVAGGYVAGTEEEGTPSEPVIGAHLACGTQFPSCLDEFMPFGTSRLVDIQLTHRLLMYLTTIAILAMTVIAVRRRAVLPPGGNRAFLLVPLLLACQILLGAINVWQGKHAGLILGHLTLGTILWGTVVYAGASLLAVPAPATEPRAEGSGGTRETQAVTA